MLNVGILGFIVFLLWAHFFVPRPEGRLLGDKKYGLIVKNHPEGLLILLITIAIVVIIFFMET